MTLLEMSLTGSVFIAVVLLLRALLLNRLPKRTFPALWSVAILRLLLPFSVASALSVYSLLPNVWELFPAEQSVSENLPVSSGTAEEPILISGGEPVPIEGKTPSAPRPLPEKTETPYFSENKPSETAKPPASPASVSAETILFILWCSGAVLSASVFTAVYLRERRKFRGSLPVEGGFAESWLAAHPTRRRVTVRRSDRIDAPLTYGLLRPVILLPDSLDRTDEKRLNCILTHEWVHICRFDALKKPICALALCVHWFNPLVWVMFFYYNRDLELACDEGVVRLLGEDQKSDYAKTLIGMEAERSGFLPLFSRFGGFAAEERIRAIMKIKKNSVIVSAAACLIVCATVGVFATSAAPKETAVKLDDGSPSSVEWWTAEEYEKWIAEQEKELESLIGTGSGWYDGEGVFHGFTRESVDSSIAKYREILEEIKQGLLVSKDNTLAGGNADRVSFAMLPPSEQAERIEADEVTAGFSDLERSIEPYRAFGVGTRLDKNGESEIVYNGKTVRGLYDEAAGIWIAVHAGMWNYGADAIDLYAVYENGVLAGVREATEAEWAENTAIRQKNTLAWLEHMNETGTWEYDDRFYTVEEFFEWIKLQKEAIEKLVEVGEWSRGEADEAIRSYDEAYKMVENGVLIGKINSLSDSRVIQSFPASEQREEEAKRTIEEIREQKINELVLFVEYKAHGLTFRESDGALVYQGKLVRWFIDGVDLDGEGAIATRYTYYNEKGEIDLCTVREKKENGDGSYDPFGKLVAIEECADLRIAEVLQIDLVEDKAVTGITYEESGAEIGFDPTAESSDPVQIVTGIQVAAAEGNGGSGGRTFSEIFAGYESFGITYNEAEGNVYWNGKLVGTFADVSEKGAFSFQSRNVGNRATVDVRTNYENGKLSSVSEMTEEQKNAKLSEDASDPDPFQYRFIGYSPRTRYGEAE